MARALETVGGDVVYGIVGYKTHCKAASLFAGPTASGGTAIWSGQRQLRTARVYADFGFFTVRATSGEDVSELFNMLTGYLAPASGACSWRRRTGDGTRRPHPREAEQRGRAAGRPDHRQDEWPPRPRSHRAAGPAEPGGCESTRSCGDLLPGPASRACGREFGHLDRQPLLRTRARVPLRQCRRGATPSTSAGPDARALEVGSRLHPYPGRRASGADREPRRRASGDCQGAPDSAGRPIDAVAGAALDRSASTSSPAAPSGRRRLSDGIRDRRPGGATQSRPR